MQDWKEAALEDLAAAIKEWRDAMQRAEEDLRRAQERISQAVPDSVHWEYRTCGKSNCRCATGPKHGPYAYRRVKRNGEWVREYLGKSYTPPKNAVSPKAWREMLHALKEARQRRDRLAARIEKAISALYGAL